jgi:hypothetical protein
MRALDATLWGAAAALTVLACLAFVPWVVPSLPATPRAAWGLVVALPVLAGLIAAFRHVERLSLLRTLDRSHDLSDLLSSAWAFSRLPDRDRGAFVNVTLVRAERAAHEIDVRRGFPWRQPRGLVWFSAAALLAAVTWFGLPPQPIATTPVREEVVGPELERVVSAERLAAFRERLARIDPGRTAGPAAELRSELEQVVEEIARGPVDRLEVLRRLDSIERRAIALARSRQTPRAEAAENQLPPSAAADSSDSLPATAQRLAPAAPAESNAPPPLAAGAGPAQPATPQPAPPEQAASAGDAPREPPGSGQRSASMQPPNSGASPNPPPGGGTPPASPPGAAQAQPVAAAPSQPGNENAPRGPDVERQRPNTAERDKAQRVADAISELRDLMRRDESVRADLGDRSQTPQAPNGPPEDSKRDVSQGNRPGAPNASYARGGPPPQSAAEGSAQPSAMPQLPAASTRIAGTASAGPVRSQIIYGAAQRGFSGGDYARVHAEYEDHAERELERETVPPLYRGYVRRYFEAIAPRPTP